jgi:prefoldin subunit 5
MNPEIEAIMSVYQRRLNDMTAQAIAFEARIQVLQTQITQLQDQLNNEPPVKRGTKKSDAGDF